MSLDPRPLPLAGDLGRAVRWLAVLSILPLAIVLGVLAYVTTHAKPGQAPAPWPLVILIPVLVGAVQALFVRSFARAGVFVAEGELIVRTGVGTQRIALSNLRKHGVRRANVDSGSPLRPWLRTRGGALPGLQSGWFRLKNGERAVCLLLDRKRVSYLRSDADNLSLLLSLRDPDALAALIERR